MCDSGMEIIFSILGVADVNPDCLIELSAKIVEPGFSDEDLVSPEILMKTLRGRDIITNALRTRYGKLGATGFEH